MCECTLRSILVYPGLDPQLNAGIDQTEFKSQKRLIWQRQNSLFDLVNTRISSFRSGQNPHIALLGLVATQFLVYSDQDNWLQLGPKYAV